MTEKAIIKVFIADDHAIVREGLKQILAETRDIVVAGEAENGLDAVKLFRKSDCQVMLLDISMPDRSGIEVLKQIKKEKPELAVLMLSMHRQLRLFLLDLFEHLDAAAVRHRNVEQHHPVSYTHLTLPTKA